ncbi:uncharacterized protein [Watersipora subatra]|uniref:uncharacterized protein n=1 Tax=Watersipora subatra TaxID=2589382 RepID=UPI00355B2844
MLPAGAYEKFLGTLFDGNLDSSYNKELRWRLLWKTHGFRGLYGNTDKQQLHTQILERRRSLPGRHDGLPNRLKKEIRESFPILDTDSDGLVSRRQVEDLVYRIDPDMTHEEMQDLLDTADLDADGMYDMDEYLFLMYLKWNDQESVDDIKEAFRVFDKDNSGALSRSEFAFILKKLGEPLIDKEVDHILNHFDRDGSGEIDFDEFAYVMTGPHVEDGSDDTGIPFTSRRSISSMSPDVKSHLSSTSGASSRKQKGKPKSAEHSRRKDDSSSGPAIYGRRIVNSAPAGRERIKFTQSGADSQKEPGSKKTIMSGTELRVLGSARPLTSKNVIKPAFVETPKDKQESESVIEHYHDLYGLQKKEARDKAVSKRDSVVSLESDNFSMCSDVIRHMNTQGETSESGYEVDQYV